MSSSGGRGPCEGEEARVVQQRTMDNEAIRDLIGKLTQTILESTQTISPPFSPQRNSACHINQTRNSRKLIRKDAVRRAPGAALARAVVEMTATAAPGPRR